jgi:hypothetical protein
VQVTQELGREHVAAERLANHRFQAPAFERPGDVVSWLLGMQGQDYAGAKWSIGLRLPGSSDAMVEAAIANGEIVRIWAMRGTLHFVAAGDVHWLLALLSPRIIARNARRYRQLELDETTLEKSNKILAGALENGERLDRKALADVLESAGISTEGQRLVYMLQRAVLERLICQGTAPKNRPLFRALAPPDEGDRDRAGEYARDRDQALAELATRYFTSRGPASLKDFVWWSGLITADARSAIESAGPALARVTIGETDFWQGDPTPERQAPGPDMMLLPGFDEFLVAYRDRSASIRDEYLEAWSRTNGMFSPSLIRRGQVIGLWKRTVKKDVVTVDIEPFTELSTADVACVERAAVAYGRYLQKTAEVNVA